MRKKIDKINNKLPTKDITKDDLENKIKLTSDKRRKKEVVIKKM